MRVLLTRPAADSERTAAKLRARGCEVLVGSVLRIDLLAPDLGGESWGALVVTSANAAVAIGQHPERATLVPLPVFAVGQRTADTLARLGFASVTSAHGNQQDLARLIATEYRGRAPMLYVAGEDRSGDLVGDLAAAQIVLQTVVVYRAAQAETLPADVEAALSAGWIEGVLHYSRRSTEAYLGCARTAGILDRALEPVHFCLSAQVAEPLIGAGAGAGGVRIAPRPDEDALINLVQS